MINEFELRESVQNQLNLCYTRNADIRLSHSPTQPRLDLISLFDPEDHLILKMLSFLYTKVSVPNYKSIYTYKAINEYFSVFSRNLPSAFIKNDIRSKKIKGAINWQKTIQHWINSSMNYVEYNLHQYQRDIQSSERKIYFYILFKLIEILVKIKSTNSNKFWRYEFQELLELLQSISFGKNFSYPFRKSMISEDDVFKLKNSQNPIFKHLLLEIYTNFYHIFVQDNKTNVNHFISSNWSKIANKHDVAEYFVLYYLLKILCGENWFNIGSFSLSKLKLAEFKLESKVIEVYFKKSIQKVIPNIEEKSELYKLKNLYSGFDPRSLQPDIIINVKDNGNNNFIIIEIKNTSIRNKQYLYTGIYKADYYNLLYKDFLGHRNGGRNNIKCFCFINEGLRIKSSLKSYELKQEFMKHDIVIIPFDFLEIESKRKTSILKDLIIG